MGLTRQQWVLIILIVLGTFVALLNQTVMTPAIPKIMVDMSVDASTAQWLTTGFTLVNAVMIPVTAFLTDRFSVKALFSASLIVFGVGSLLAAVSSNFAILLIGRLVQAAGAGIMMPLGMTVLLRTFPVDKRGTAMGVFGLVIAFAPAIGPTVAGAVIDNFDWHIMFYVITVLVAIVVLCALIFLRRDNSECKKVKLDILSVVLSSVGFGALLYGLSAIGSDYGLSVGSTIGIVVGAVVLVLFFYRQVSMDEPMLQVRVLTNRRYLISVITVMIVQAALMGGSILMPIYMQNDLGFSALDTGLVMLPGAIITGIMSPISGMLFDRYGPRVLGIIGMILTVVATTAFMFLTDSATLVYLMVIYAIRMFGMTLVNMPINTWGMNALPNSLINHGTSVVNTFRQVAGSFGTAILVSVYSIAMVSQTEEIGEIQASIHGINMAFMVSTILCIIGLILVIIFVNNKPVKHDEKTDEEEADDSSLEAIMQHEVYGIPESASVLEAIQALVSRGIHGAPLLNEDGEAVGFISDGDVIRYISRESTEITDANTMITHMLKTGSEDQPLSKKLDDLLQMNVGGIATGKVISIDIDTDVVETCRIMAAHRLKKAPVVKDDVVVGMINRTDVLKYALRAYKAAHEQDEHSISIALIESSPEEIDALASETDAPTSTVEAPAEVSAVGVDETSAEEKSSS